MCFNWQCSEAAKVEQPLALLARLDGDDFERVRRHVRLPSTHTSSTSESLRLLRLCTPPNPAWNVLFTSWRKRVFYWRGGRHGGEERRHCSLARDGREASGTTERSCGADVRYGRRRGEWEGNVYEQAVMRSGAPRASSARCIGVSVIV